jgi:hypothetical protein
MFSQFHCSIKITAFKYYLLAALLTLLFGTYLESWCASSVDHGIYAELLEQYVRDGLVDYRGFKADEERLDAYLVVLEGIDPSVLSSKDQFAFYVNAYNAWTIKLILTAYPGVRSIKDLGSWFTSPWENKFVRLDGTAMSLDHIEKNILRRRFPDPRIHVALNCASRSCPPLRREPYTGIGLEQQLDEQATAFVNDPTRNRLEGSTLFVSKIFKWYKDDFPGGPLPFFYKYTSDDLKRKLEVHGDSVTIKYLDYDWSLNSR